MKIEGQSMYEEKSDLTYIRDLPSTSQCSETGWPTQCQSDCDNL